MDKSQSPLFAELALGVDTQDSTGRSPGNFAGIKNRRYLRVIHALRLRPHTRKEIDKIAGASNGPQVIANLRKLGLNVPCLIIRGVDCDGKATGFGLYSLTLHDHDKLMFWNYGPAQRKVANEK
jgi:hypothetical protein